MAGGISVFTAAELDELRRFDAYIESNFNHPKRGRPKKPKDTDKQCKRLSWERQAKISANKAAYYQKHKAEILAKHKEYKKKEKEKESNETGIQK